MAFTARNGERTARRVASRPRLLVLDAACCFRRGLLDGTLLGRRSGRSTDLQLRRLLLDAVLPRVWLGRQRTADKSRSELLTAHAVGRPARQQFLEALDVGLAERDDVLADEVEHHRLHCASVSRSARAAERRARAGLTLLARPGSAAAGLGARGRRRLALGADGWHAAARLRVVEGREGMTWHTARRQGVSEHRS